PRPALAPARYCRTAQGLRRGDRGDDHAVDRRGRRLQRPGGPPAAPDPRRRGLRPDRARRRAAAVRVAGRPPPSGTRGDPPDRHRARASIRHAPPPDPALQVHAAAVGGPVSVEADPVPLPAPPLRHRRWIPVAALAVALAAVTSGGYLTADALGEVRGGAVAVNASVRVTPFPGWELAGRSSDPDRIRLTSGSTSL